jgi:hypothetical protein
VNRLAGYCRPNGSQTSSERALGDVLDRLRPLMALLDLGGARAREEKG